MNWLSQGTSSDPVVHALGMLSLVCMAGMALGSLKMHGIGLGTAGVLFAGIIAGSVLAPADQHTLEFVKEFGLILFVFTIGLQLGPGFFAAFRRLGVRLNLIAAAVVLSGAGLAVAVGWSFRMDFAAVLGLLWLGTGHCVTILPLMLVGMFARAVLKCNYAVLAGLIAGSVTDPLALAVATSVTRSDVPTVAYATVYPLATLLRILCAQVLSVVLFR